MKAADRNRSTPLRCLIRIICNTNVASLREPHRFSLSYLEESHAEMQRRKEVLSREAMSPTVGFLRAFAPLREHFYLAPTTPGYVIRGFHLRGVTDTQTPWSVSIRAGRGSSSWDSPPAKACLRRMQSNFQRTSQRTLAAGERFAVPARLTDPTRERGTRTLTRSVSEHLDCSRPFWPPALPARRVGVCDGPSHRTYIMNRIEQGDYDSPRLAGHFFADPPIPTLCPPWACNNSSGNVRRARLSSDGD